MKLKSIEIKGIWGSQTIRTNFFDDTNVFIGNNGTGKTTFLNILESILTVDIEQIFSCSFEEVTIQLEGNNMTRKLIVTKQLSEVNFVGLVYKIGTKKFNLPFLREFDMRNLNRIHPKYRNEIKSLKDELATLINICWLSVHREVSSQEDNEYHSSRESKEKNTIDQRLSDLMRRLTIYQLQLESESSKLSSKFREQVFESMLYKSDFDEINLENLSTAEDPEEIKKKLNKAYKDLGLSSKETHDKISMHTQKIGVALQKIEQWKSNRELGIAVNDVTPLSLLKRTLSMINISTQIDLQKREVFKPIDTYISILKEFVPNKIFKLDTESSGELNVFSSKDSNKPLPIKFLSSGEKQLIILLTEALLQKNVNYVFIADEPELSLHISWQQKILKSIHTLNNNAQIIVATHSPEIAGQWHDKIINMENILHYEQQK